MLPSSAQTFEDRFDVSRETLSKLEQYHMLLLKWQGAINLVGPKTVNDAWMRHFIDSAQIETLISPDKKVADLGSGAGFPGLVLCIMRPDLTVSLIESDQRKAQFLRTVSRETQVRATIYNERVEEILPEVAPDIITARALAPVRALLDYAQPLITKAPDMQMVLLKGAKVDLEIEEAAKLYSFSHKKYDSMTDHQASILVLSNIHKQ